MEQQDRRKRYGKALASFFVVIVACTVISRGADAMTIPTVQVQKAESGRITYRLKGEGTVEPAEKVTFLAPEGCLVEECLSDGAAVKEGDVLLRFQMEYLMKRKEELERVLQEAELSLEQARLNQQEDAWIPAAAEAERSLEEAGAELREAEEVREQAVAELREAEAALEVAGEGREEGERALEVDGGTGVPDETEAEQQRLDAARQALAGADQRLESASQAVSQAEQAHRAAEQSDAVTRKNQVKTRRTADLGVESAQLAVDTAREKLSELEKLVEAEGELCAGAAGIFQNPGVAAGTVTSGSELLGIGTGGLLFTAELPVEEQERLAVGDEIMVKLPGKEKCKTAVTGVTVQKEARDGQEILLLKAGPLELQEPWAGQAAFSLEKKSAEKYEMIVPLTALRQDSRGYYCLSVKEQSSILGKELRAEQIRVTLKDQDETKAAVEGAVLPDTRIIVSSEKQVEAGDRVRLKEQES